MAFFSNKRKTVQHTTTNIPVINSCKYAFLLTFRTFIAWTAVTVKVKFVPDSGVAVTMGWLLRLVTEGPLVRGPRRPTVPEFLMMNF